MSSGHSRRSGLEVYEKKKIGKKKPEKHAAEKTLYCCRSASNIGSSQPISREFSRCAELCDDYIKNGAIERWQLSTKIKQKSKLWLSSKRVPAHKQPLERGRSDPASLSPAVAAATRKANVKQKPFMLIVFNREFSFAHSFGEFISKIRSLGLNQILYSSKPKQVEVVALPILWECMKAGVSDSDMKKAVAEFAKGLTTLVCRCVAVHSRPQILNLLYFFIYWVGNAHNETLCIAVTRRGEMKLRGATTRSVFDVAGRMREKLAKTGVPLKHSSA